MRRRFGKIGSDEVDIWLLGVASLIAPKLARLDLL